MIWNPWRALRTMQREYQRQAIDLVAARSAQAREEAEIQSQERLIEMLRHELAQVQEDFRRLVTMLGVQVATRPAMSFEPEVDPFAERAGVDEWLSPSEQESPNSPAIERVLEEPSDHAT